MNNENKIDFYKDFVKHAFFELSFPTEEMRDKFMEKYRELIEIYFKIK